MAQATINGRVNTMLGSPQSKVSEPLVNRTGQKPTFTFYDMDDTLVNIRENLIKNAHLLLPIMLFQTLSKNQTMGILTNRHRRDEETQGYKVAEFIQNVANFGIQIPLSYVRFGGGANANKISSEYKGLEQSVATLCQQLSSLSMHAPVERQIQSVKDSMTLIIEKKFMGKNFIIIDFLNDHLVGDNYVFENMTIPVNELLIGIVDDLEGIAEAAEALGNNFFGIKASRGGKAPEDLSEQSRSSEDELYYSDQYLVKLAKTIGMTTYLRSLRKSPAEHQEDPAMLKAAALLFGMHAKSKNINIKQILDLLPELSQTEVIQLCLMVECIVVAPNTHKDACYKPMDELLAILRERSELTEANFEDFKFLNTAQAQYKMLKTKQQEENSHKRHSQSDSSLLHSPKRSLLGSMKSLSRRSRNRALQLPPQKSKVEQLFEQVKKITLSDSPYIAKMARNILLGFKKQGQAELLASTIRNNSRSSSNSEALNSPRVLTRANDLEKQKRRQRRKSAPQLSSSDEIPMVETASAQGKTEKSKKKLKKKAGSNFY